MDVQTILQLGIAAAMLWWFAARLEAKLELTSAALDRLTRAILIMSAGAADMTSAAKSHAASLLDELDNPKGVTGQPADA